MNLRKVSKYGLNKLVQICRKVYVLKTSSSEIKQGKHNTEKIVPLSILSSSEKH